MKLDKTLEEIKLHNKSLTDNKFKITREYFELRLHNDKELSKLRTTHNEQKAELVYNIKQIKNISIQKIDFNISLYKNNIKNINDIDKITLKIYHSLLESFERSNDIYYKNNKDAIINYISKICKIKVEMSELNNKLCTNLSIFIKDNNINKYNLTKLVSMYKELKMNLEVYSKYCDNIDEFKKHLSEKQELISITEEIFLNEIKNINNSRCLHDICTEKDKQDNLDYRLEVSRVYTSKIGNTIKEQNSTKESELENIVNTSFIELKDDEDVIKYKKRLKELEARAEERKLKKANMTKEEREKLKQKKKDNEILVAKMFKLE